ncbi:hypothetical protein L2E82_02050 [Cichorium intybus]|uniref:Uncharacterized protein n=1 Tax=Cichorium intybus TaxID=13427 RepID=A0ACB9H1N6_CICIN|nr:hypothetical protein L2E82_02050 [Cichorium intybus]
MGTLGRASYTMGLWIRETGQAMYVLVHAHRSRKFKNHYAQGQSSQTHQLNRNTGPEVHADVISVMLENMESWNLDLFSCLLPLFLGLLDGNTERDAYKCVTGNVIEACGSLWACNHLHNLSSSNCGC